MRKITITPVIAKMLIFLALGMTNAILFYYMVWGQNGILSLKELRRQHDELVIQNEELATKCLLMSHSIRLLKTDTNYQETMIRQRLRYIRDNEFVYIFSK